MAVHTDAAVASVLCRSCGVGARGTGGAVRADGPIDALRCVVLQSDPTQGEGPRGIDPAALADVRRQAILQRRVLDRQRGARGNIEQTECRRTRAVLRPIVSPLPTIVRLSPAAITGRPFAPFVVLLIAVSV